jgi:UDP-N-acetylglucosamine 1-carboxyvinyltransferase
MNETIKIRGGQKLSGEVDPIPNKNALMAVLPASLLTDEDVVYYDVPQTSDVEKHLAILKYLGAKVDYKDYQKITINCRSIDKWRIDLPEASEFRSSVLYIGPLLVRFGKARIPLPGGCVLGTRAINAHIEVFQKVGAKVECTDNYADFSISSPLKGEYRIWQKEASVTGTENISMLAAGSKAQIQILNSASEPHVTDLLRMLSSMGAEIFGIESNNLKISGSRNLVGTEFHPRPDPIDIAGYVVAAALTKGKITIKNAYIPNIVDGLISYFAPFNINFVKDGSDLVVSGTKILKINADTSGFPLAEDRMPKFKPGPWPRFPVDALPVVVTLATKTKGKILIQNWMYEAGLQFTNLLNMLGANILMVDSQRIIVEGPCTYKGGDVTSPGIIQACKALFLAGLCDDVETTIHGADILKRRYPDIIEKYNSLGAKIEQLD